MGGLCTVPAMSDYTIMRAADAPDFSGDAVTTLGPRDAVLELGDDARGAMQGAELRAAGAVG
jgi:hypothetical protein